MVCVYGLGETAGYCEPLEELLGGKYNSKLSIAGFARDLDVVAQHASIKGGITHIATLWDV